MNYQSKAAYSEKMLGDKSKNALSVSGLKTEFVIEKTPLTGVDGVSLYLKPGEIIGVVGESGSGKSVSMLSLLQLVSSPGKVTGGEVYLKDDPENLLTYKPDSEKMREVRGGKIGIIFQEPMTSLNPVLTVGYQISENIRLHLGLDAKAAKKKAIEMMRLVQIRSAESRYNYYPQQFSGGMRQRVMIAMVLAAQPDIIIADEATTALDVTTQAQILETLRDIAVNTGISVVIVTHNLGIVARFAKRIYVMYSGSVVETSDTKSIFNHSAHPYTKGLMKAIPRLSDPKDRVLIPIDGMPPTLVTRPKFCPFYDRCDYRMDKCRERDIPALEEVRPDHWAACWLTQEEKDAKEKELSMRRAGTAPTKTISDEVCLSIEHVSKSFPVLKGIMKKQVGITRALEDVSFSLRKGETLGIVGESGCGKTTLARCITRFYEPTSGKICLGDKDISHLSDRQLLPYRKRISMIFQDPFSSLDPRQNVESIIGEPLRIHKLARNSTEYGAKVDELLLTVGLDPDMRIRFPHEFSGGQRQRLGIARALASQPDLILCDEPISALDVSIQAQIINILEEIQAAKQISYLFISHDLAVVKHISDRILVMYLGRMVELGGYGDVCDSPLHPYTKVLLSSVPDANPDIEEKRERMASYSEIPGALSRPSGCPFSSQCPSVMDRCKTEVPELREVKEGHSTACFLYQ